jgi:UDP-glucose 4-epimerase
MEDKCEIFNIGTGNGHSVLEVINAFEKNTGIKLNWSFSLRREGDIEQIWADSTYCNLTLGWKAKLGIDEMVLSAWNWEKSLKKGIN